MRQTSHFLSIAALVIAGALASGCAGSKDLLEISKPEEAPGRTVILTTSVGFGTLPTRALDLSDGRKTFSVGDRIAVVYTNTGGETVKAVSWALTEDDIREEGKEATITVRLTDPAENAAVRFIYPAEMAAEDGSVDFGALGLQDGTPESLARLDLAVFDGTMDGSSLPESVLLENQLAICAFTFKDDEGTDLTAGICSLTITDGSRTYSVQHYGAGPIYVALVPVGRKETLLFSASDGTSWYIKRVTGKAIAAGSIYPVGVCLDTPGLLLVGSDDGTLCGAGNADVLFGDKGISGLKQRIANQIGIDADELTDMDVILFVHQHSDLVAGWPGADNSETDPNTGDSLDKPEVLLGGAAGDVLFAQGGNDFLFGDASLTAVQGWLNISSDYWSVSNARVKIDAMDIATLKTGLAGLETAGDGNDLLHGGDGRDRIFGLGGDDILLGGYGDDLLLGGSGNDKLEGGSGSDYLDGGNGADTILGGAGVDIIRFDAADSIDGGDGLDILLGDSADGPIGDLPLVSNVEVFLKLDGGDIDEWNLIDLDNLAAMGFYGPRDDAEEITLTCDDSHLWDLDSVVTEDGITRITYSNGSATLILETTLQVMVDRDANEIILTRG